MVEVFREVRRVLADDGTLWLNIGSSYFGSNQTGGTNSIQGSAKRRGAMFKRADVVGDTHPSQLLGDVPACGSDGTEPQGSTASGSSCSDLCDGCLGDWLTHRDRIADTTRQPSQSEQQPSRTGRDSGHSDSVSASPDASLPDVPASVRLDLGCNVGSMLRAAIVVLLPFQAFTHLLAMMPFSRMTWLDYTTS
jgi:hypothetical protein